MDDSPKKNALPIEQRALTLARRPISLAGKAGRLTQVLRHYDSIQIFRRGCSLLAKKMQPGKLIGNVTSNHGQLKENALAKSIASCVAQSLSEHPSHQQCDLSVGQYTMLNDSVSMPKGIDPHVLNQQSHLWRFQFHYHEFLLTQTSKGNWSYIGTFLKEWLARYSPEKVKCSDDSWHPYCISRRLVAWVWLLHQSDSQRSLSQANGLDSELVDQLLDSLIQQANYLCQNLERDLGGNHLLENVTALAIASSTIETSHSKQWSDIATAVLAVELSRQVLSHGEHFELSPMYHCQILSNLLRIEACCQSEQEMLDVVSPKIDPMLNFLSSILHPDGEIPLFADSGFYEAPSVKEIEAVAELTDRKLEFPSANKNFEAVGGYRIFRSDNMFAICDFGPIAARKLPAHGHCDATNLEVSVAGKRWIIDSGNFNYGDDSMRHYCRSSMGHNVVTVDDVNQANIWSKFRMGDRPKKFVHRRGVRNRWHWASVAHDSYRKLGVPRLSRLVAFQDQAAFCFDHGVSSRGNENSLVGYLHLHPEIAVSRETDSSDGVTRYRLSLGSTIRTLLVFADEVSTEQGWYCSGFGQRKAGTVVRYTRAVSGPILGWVLHDFDDDPQIQCSTESILITIDDIEVPWKEFIE